MHEQESLASEAIRYLAREFVSTALPILAGDHLFPRSGLNPFLRVGTDYNGSSLATPEHRALEEAITAAHQRFSDSTPLGERDFATNYTFSFLEACITRLTFAEDCWSVGGVEVDESIDELITAVSNKESEIACCRVVSHLTTVDCEEVDFGDVRVIPIGHAPESHGREVREIMASVIAGSGSAFRYSGGVRSWAPPESVLVARSTRADPFDAASELSQRLSRFLLVAQLLRSGTSQSSYEVQGGTTMVGRLDPQLLLFKGEVGLMSRTQTLRRDLVMSPADAQPIRELDILLGRCDVEREGLAVDPLALAVHLFQRSYYASSPYDQVVDLMTAMEAAMSGSAKTEILLRLRTRCASLLAVQNDTAHAIFSDVGQLYDLRSTIVHGGEMKLNKLTKLLMSLTYTPPNTPLADAFGHAVDRLRDLVRRSILVRVCLAGSDRGLWPLGDDAGVDSALTDDVQRQAWRSDWHDTLNGIGAGSAAERPRPAQSYLATFSDR